MSIAPCGRSVGATPPVEVCAGIAGYSQPNAVIVNVIRSCKAGLVQRDLQVAVEITPTPGAGIRNVNVNRGYIGLADEGIESVMA